jgi:raffinose/stachyose/melibiose transport system substrate-binding protein
MMRRLLLFLLIGLIPFCIFAGGKQEVDGGDSDKISGSLELLQNKPEIVPMLNAYNELWSKNTGIKMNSRSSSRFLEIIKADYAAGDMADIFIAQGLTDFMEWESVLLDLSGEQWTEETELDFVYDGKTLGFPVAVEGYGMIYNAEILEKAGIDPKTLNSYDSFKKAFQKIDTMKDQLGLDSVISMTADMSMEWLTADKVVNPLYSNGLPYGDKTVVNKLKNKNFDNELMQRIDDWVDFVELIFVYADPKILATGDFDTQVNAFSTRKAAFIYQGNWLDPWFTSTGVDFKMGMLPVPSLKKRVNGVFAAAPSYYVVYKDSENIPAATKYLNDLVFTEEGWDYMVNEALMLPAFTNKDMLIPGQLSSSLKDYLQSGNILTWNEYEFTPEFRYDILAPLFNQYGKGAITKEQFKELFIKAYKDR